MSIAEKISEVRSLIRSAEERGADAPPLVREASASAAAEQLQALLQREQLSERERAQLQILHANALRLAGPQHDLEAQSLFREALAAFANESGWWFDFGLLHKWRGRFADALACFEHAQRLQPDQRGTLWNLAICATALGDGTRATEIWRGLGLAATQNPKSNMPFIENMPPLLVRVPSRRNAWSESTLPDRAVGFELLWVAPASPCHGVVQSPSFGDCPVDYGDMVLWDGAPVARHRAEAIEVPVFPLLEILRRGEEQRFLFLAQERRAGAWPSWESRLGGMARVFLSQETFHNRCTQGHEQSSTLDVGRVLFGKLICAPPALQKIREEILNAAHAGVEIAMPGFFEHLHDTAHAGQHHKAWGRLASDDSKK